MNGKLLVSVFVAAAALFGAALWYFQIYAHYEQVSGLEAITVQDRRIAVADYRGIDAATSPNKLRGCFTVDPAAFDGVVLAENPDPLVAPPWFDCFDAEAIAGDLASGRATAYLAADETPEAAAEYEVVRIIAVYPDGRAFMWRHYRED